MKQEVDVEKWKRQGEAFSDKLSKFMRKAHKKRIIITDSKNNHVFHFPILFFIVITLLLPVFVGILIFIFLLTEYHAILEEEQQI